jgi:hypothetical protein
LFVWSALVTETINPTFYHIALSVPLAPKLVPTPLRELSVEDKAAMQFPNIQTAPSISITLALNQDVLQEGEAVELCATAVSHALFPITIHTRDSFLDLDLVQRMIRSSTNFQCIDLDADTPPV